MPVTAREVVVAEVPVAFWNVKFCRVEEAPARRLVRVARPLLSTENTVDEALVTASIRRPVPDAPQTERREQGVVVPTAVLPVLLIANLTPPPESSLIMNEPGALV